MTLVQEWGYRGIRQKLLFEKILLNYKELSEQVIDIQRQRDVIEK